MRAPLFSGGCTKGIDLHREELENVARRFRLSGKAFSLRDLIFGVWDRDKVIVPEIAPLYPYVVKAGIGLEVEVRDGYAQTGAL